MATVNYVSGLKTRIDPMSAVAGFRNVSMRQGSQILRIPEKSSIENITLDGGASYECPWTALRGAVFKFFRDRTQPVIFDGQGLIIPSAHTLMDARSLEITIKEVNAGIVFPYQEINLGKETFYLIHSSWCHPKDLFLPQGQFTKTTFFPPRREVTNITWLKLEIREEELDITRKPYNILTEASAQTVIVSLKEGGTIILNR